MLRPLYHSILEKLEFSECQLSLPWYKQSHPVPCLENEKAEVLWDIPGHLEKCPRNGDKKPEVSVLDKVDKRELTVYQQGHFQKGQICRFKDWSEEFIFCTQS